MAAGFEGGLLRKRQERTNFAILFLNCVEVRFGQCCGRGSSLRDSRARSINRKSVEIIVLRAELQAIKC